MWEKTILICNIELFATLYDIKIYDSNCVTLHKLYTRENAAGKIFVISNIKWGKILEKDTVRDVP